MSETDNTITVRGPVYCNYETIVNYNHVCNRILTEESNHCIVLCTCAYDYNCWNS